MNTSTLSDEMLSVVWSPEKYDSKWKNEYLLTLLERCKDSGNSIAVDQGKNAIRHWPALPCTTPQIPPKPESLPLPRHSVVGTEDWLTPG